MSSKYSDESSSEGYICPYCKEESCCDDWGYDYDGEVVECHGCGKKFEATANHSVAFVSAPDCELNNEKHDLEFYKNEGSNNASYFCKVCEKCVIKEIET